MIRRVVPRWQATRGPTALFFPFARGRRLDDTRRVEFFLFFFLDDKTLVRSDMTNLNMNF